MFTLLFYALNIALFDPKDATADRAAGIRTFANTLSRRHFFRGAAGVVLGLAVCSVLVLPAHLTLLGLVTTAFYAVTVLCLSRRPLDMMLSAGIDGGCAAVLILAWLV